MTTQCPKCQSENADMAKFCSECATPLRPSKHVSVTKTLQTPTRGFKKDTVIAKKYKIIEKLGEGGMGVVYKAKDTRLKRIVALKFLPAELTQDEESKKRFVQEAQAAAALEHPNICIVHEVDEADGQTFIAMSFIEGQSLKDKLKDGPLSIDEAKDIALQVAEGLKEAHEKGIVHRDIKPANIMLAIKRQVKVMDFGLAKLSWGADLTKTSTIMGTVAYMSPEQAKGEKVDHRSDIWSLGAMLYEMLSGERPFQKSQEQALIYAILNDKPTPLSLLRSDIPEYMEQAIEKALAKKATDRYQSMDDLIQDLKRSTALPKAEKSILALPFENLSPEPEQEYFCDGITEEIISDLSKIHSLRVISRTSAMMLKGTKKAIKTIGRELDVQYVLEGSVRKSGNKLRITAQLIEASSDAHLWAEKYSGTLDDVFDIQEKVSKSIVEALKLTLTPGETRSIVERPIENIQAYEYYLKANAEILTFTEAAINRALRYLQYAIDIVGDNPLICSTMALGYWNLVNIGVKHEECLAKAIESAEKALAIDPEFPKAHTILGWINHLGGNLDKSAFHLKKALALSPDDPLAVQGLAVVYILSGKMSAGMPLIEKLLNIDPYEKITIALQSLLYLYDGQYERALQAAQKLYEMYPEDPHFQLWYSIELAYNKELDKAFSIIEQNAKANPDSVFAKLGLILKYGILNDKDKAFQEMTPDFQKTCQRDPTFCPMLAGAFAMLGEKEESLNWLENAVDAGFINYPFLSEKDPFLENIRNEPQFKKLMERVKHEWENFEV